MFHCDFYTMFGLRGRGEKLREIKSMFDNYFFLLFSVFKNNFLFLRLKNFFDNPK